ncbi:hypothetical protein C8R44DRAFT_741806 [Mycena epipterygia]|nr:hypothetical protein C8R44DRAFT_741806 [Mycena epipterygia]
MSTTTAIVNAHPWRSLKWWACGELTDGRITRDRAIAHHHVELGNLVYRSRTFRGAVHKVRRRIHLLNPDQDLYYLLPNGRITINWDDAFEEYRKLEKQGSFIVTTDDLELAEEALDWIIADLDEDYSSAWSVESELDGEVYI